MRVLIGCEESGIVCKEFLDAGHDAFSCDLLATRGVHRARHIIADVKHAIRDGWDLIILHPPCTALAVSGNRWYGNGMPREPERAAAIKWTVDLWELAKRNASSVALENPVSVIFKYLNTDVQYIQPWQFGHGETKRTGFALHNLPPLMPTNIVDGREPRVHKMPPGPNRQRDRSTTYQGVADAMAGQWGMVAKNE